MAPLVSLHHIDFVESLFPSMTQIESLKRLVRAYEVDPVRTLQQSICYDFSRNRSVSVAWGYSVQLYPSLVTTEELETPFQTFQTWRSWGSQPFTFNTRPMSQEPCERPVIYFLDRVQMTGINGQTLTTYERLGFQPEKDCNQSHYAPLLAVHSFNVSAFQLRPESWEKVINLSLYFSLRIINLFTGVDSVAWLVGSDLSLSMQCPSKWLIEVFIISCLS